MQVHEWLADTLYQYVAKNVNYSLPPRPTLVISLAARYKVTHNNITVWLDGGVMPNITGTILMHVPSPGPQYVPQAKSANLHYIFEFYSLCFTAFAQRQQNRYRCQKYG